MPIHGGVTMQPAPALRYVTHLAAADGACREDRRCRAHGVTSVRLGVEPR